MGNTEKKLKEALGDSYDSEDTGVLTRTAIDTGIVSSALFSAQSFLTLSQIGTSFGLSLLLNATRPDDPHYKDHTLAWMPMALAKDEEDAAKQMIKIAVESFKNMPDDHEWKIDWAKTNANMQKIGNSFLNSRYEFTLYFEGGECDVFDCMFFIYLDQKSPLLILSLLVHIQTIIVSSFCKASFEPSNLSRLQQHAILPGCMRFITTEMAGETDRYC